MSLPSTLAFSSSGQELKSNEMNIASLNHINISNKHKRWLYQYWYNSELNQKSMCLSIYNDPKHSIPKENKYSLQDVQTHMFDPLLNHHHLKKGSYSKAGANSPA